MELGGPDYSKAAPKVTDSKGQEVAELTGMVSEGRGGQLCTCDWDLETCVTGRPTAAAARRLMENAVVLLPL